MSHNYIKSVVLVGAGGNAGSAILTALLATNRFAVTILSRPESTSQFPDGVKVVKGSYGDPLFLAETFKEVDAAIITLSFTSLSQESVLIEAAVKAGVQWIVPNEYAGDGDNVELVARVPAYQPKLRSRELIKKLGCKYLAISTGPWTDYCLKSGMFRIRHQDRSAVLASGLGKFNTSTLQQLGKGVAALLSLPVKNAKEPDHSLNHYANSFVYISSLYTSQSELFEAMKRATNTTDSEWTIEREDSETALKQADQQLAAGDMSGMLVNLTYNYMGEGRGGDVEVKAARDRKVLGLHEENVDEVVRQSIAA